MCSVSDYMELERLVFTQCGMVVGAAFGCSVVSVRDGPLVLGFTWQQGVVDEALMDGIDEGVKRGVC